MANTPKGFTKGIAVQNETDRSKQLLIDVDSTATTGTSTTFKSKQTANRTLELPNVSGELVEKDATQTLTNKTIDADNNTITNIENADIKASANIALTKLATVTASRALESNGSGVITPSTVTSTELARLSGITSTVVGVDDVQTLTNKTIDGDNNTIQDISLSSLKTVLVDANEFIVRDVTGAVVSANTVPSGTVVGTSDTQTLTNKTIDADLNTISNIDNADIKSGANIAVNKLAALTTNRALVTDGSGVITPATTTAIEIGYVNGVTSAIQTQIDSKQTRSVLTTKGDLYVATASDTVTRQGVGTDGQILTADSSQANGIRWATAPTAPDSSYEITNLTLACSVASNALTISVKTKANADASGGDSIKIGMRSSTLTSGLYNQRTLSSALSLVISSGSTLGHSSGNAHNIWVYLLDNAGTLELAVSQTLFPESGLITTVAEGGAGAADSNRVVYSATARTNVPFRTIGKLVSTQTTAGTWAAVPTQISVGTSGTLGQDTVYAEYTTSAGQSMSAGSFTIINYNNKNIDTHNTVVTGGSWVFTAPRSDVYEIEACFAGASQAASSQKILSLFKNGSEYRRISRDRNATASPDDQPGSGAASLYLSAGDTINLRGFLTTAQSLTAADLDNWVTIKSKSNV